MQADVKEADARAHSSETAAKAAREKKQSKEQSKESRNKNGPPGASGARAGGGSATPAGLNPSVSEFSPAGAEVPAQPAAPDKAKGAREGGKARQRGKDKAARDAVPAGQDSADAKAQASGLS